MVKNTGIDLIEKVLECLMFTNDDMQWFYNAETNEFLLQGSFIDEIGDDEENDALICLPSRFEIDEYGMMKEFAYSRVSECDRLLETLRGRGAFRRFKDRVYEFGIEKEWFEYRDNQYREIAEEWCRRNGLLSADDI